MRNTVFATLFVAIVLIFCAHAANAGDASAKLQEARHFLTGDHKDTGAAKKLLLDVVQDPGQVQDPDSLCMAYIYLGYIEDRDKNREAATGWYAKAAAIGGTAPFVAELAASGIKQPLVWIRHLDSDAAREEQKAAGLHKTPAQPNRGGKAYIAKDPPELALATNLSANERRENFEALLSIIDASYADFELKSIDWQQVGRRYTARLDSITTDDDFYLTMFQLVNELKDTHSWLNNYHPAALFTVRDMPIDIFENRPFIVAGDKAGWEVLAIDGMTIPDRIESLRPFISARSSERAFRREAVRSLLAGKELEPVSVTLRSPQGQTETLTLKRGGRSSPAPSRQVSVMLTKQQFVDFGRYPSGLGYIHIRSFNGRKEITKEFDSALDSLRDTSGLILDIRDNPGGFNHDDIVGRFLHKRAFVGYSYTKNGVQHNQLNRIKSHIEPRKWEYKRHVALLISDMTGSAADLFTLGMRKAPRVTTIGTTTHGNLSGSAIYAVLPCGLVVRISNGYFSDTKDRSIEVNGNVPDITVETSIQDYLHGHDPVLERACEVLLLSERGGCLKPGEHASTFQTKPGIALGQIRSPGAPSLRFFIAQGWEPQQFTRRIATTPRRRAGLYRWRRCSRFWPG
jgi:carboxyl-terminal processing protease